MQTRSRAVDGSIELDRSARYAIDRELGHGAASVVFDAKDRVLGRRVALKVFRDVSTTPYEVRRREQEVRHLVDARHPGVVELFDRFTDHRGRDVFVFEAMKATLETPALGSRRGPLSSLRVAGRQAASALAHVHALGLVHRDIKPANILSSGFGAARTVKIADFGLAAYQDERELPVAGSIEFMAPEQIDGAPASTASDVYALGLTLLQFCTGKPAYTGTTLEIAIQRTVKPVTIEATLPSRIRHALAAATAIDPAERLSATELADEFTTGSH